MTVASERSGSFGWGHVVVPVFFLVTVAVVLAVAGREAEATPPDCSSVTAVAFGGAPTAGSIAVAGEKDCFQVSGTRGDRVRVRVVENPAGPLVPSIQVFNPSDVSRCGPSTFSDVTCVLGATGTHTIQVRDNAGTSTGSYVLAVQRLNSPVGCTTLSFGTAPTAASVSGAGEMDCFTFAGSAGDRVWRRVVTTSGALNPWVQLYRPDGTEVCPDDSHGVGSFDDFTCELDTSGDHSVLVRDSAGTSTGNYVIGLQRENAPVGCTTLTFGALSQVGSISSAAEINCFQFPTSVGDRFRARVVHSSGALDPLSDVVLPGGTFCTRTSADDITCEVDATGDAAVFVRDAGSGTKTGSYTISVQRLNNPVGCTTLSFGDPPVAGSIAGGGEMDCFQFSGSAGDQARVRLVETPGGALNPAHELLRPNGTSICGPTASDDGTCGLDVTGSHMILVTTGSGASTGNYALALQRLNSPVGCTTLTLGPAPTSASISLAGEMDCFRFSGSLGSQMRLRVVRTAGTVDPSAEVVRPNGTTSCPATTTDDSTCPVDTDGTHTVVVRDAGGPKTGDYVIAVQRLNKPIGCSALTYGAAPIGGSISAVGETDCFTFSGAAGHQVRVRVVATSGGVLPSAEVVRPNGTTVCAPTTTFDVNCPMDTTGTHAVLVNNQNATTGTYVIAVHRLNKPVGCTTLSLGAVPTAASITAPGEADCFKFAGSAGDQVRLRVVATSAGSFSPSTEAFRPNGTSRCAGATNDDSTCALDTTGTHAVFIWGNGALTGNYTIALQRLNRPVGCTTLSFGTQASATLTAAGEMDCFKVTGTAGDRIRVSAAPTAVGVNPHSEIFRPNGSTRCTPGTSDLTTCVLDTTGTHALLVKDQPGVNTGDYVITVYRLNALAGCATLNFGAAPTAAAISDPGELDCFRVSASGGDRIWVRMVSTSGTADLDNELLRPNGSTRCPGDSFDDWVCSLDATDAHTIVVSDTTATRTGDYVILVQLLNAPVGCADLTLGGPAVNGSISSEGEMDCLRFSGTAGTQVAFQISGGFGPSVIVIRPNGTTACNNEFTFTYTCALDVTGTYTFLIRDDSGTGTGSYSVTANEL